jgi:hypothetical protein
MNHPKYKASVGNPDDLSVPERPARIGWMIRTTVQRFADQRPVG